MAKGKQELENLIHALEVVKRPPESNNLQVDNVTIPPRNQYTTMGNTGNVPNR